MSQPWGQPPRPTPVPAEPPPPHPLDKPASEWLWIGGLTLLGVGGIIAFFGLVMRVVNQADVYSGRSWPEVLTAGVFVAAFGLFCLLRSPVERKLEQERAAAKAKEEHINRIDLEETLAGYGPRRAQVETDRALYEALSARVIAASGHHATVVQALMAAETEAYRVRMAAILAQGDQQERLRREERALDTLIAELDKINNLPDPDGTRRQQVWDQWMAERKAKRS